MNLSRIIVLLILALLLAGTSCVDSLTLTASVEADDNGQRVMLSTDSYVLSYILNNNWEVFTDMSNIPGAIQNIVKQVEANSNLKVHMMAMSENISGFAIAVTDKVEDFFSLDQYINNVIYSSRYYVDEYFYRKAVVVDGLEAVIWSYSTSDKRNYYYEFTTYLDGYAYRLSVGAPVDKFYNQFDDFFDIFKTFKFMKKETD